ncbi:MAG TPA: hypothetical protein PK208_15970 [Fibrobacteria bacterium]|nr:hypothetical protein [Fibrobacteria bacterium]
MKHLAAFVAVFLLSGCGKKTEITIQPFVYTEYGNGVVVPDSHAVVVVSTFGGILNNVTDYALWSCWPNFSESTKVLNYPRFSISVLNGLGGYNALAISHDSLYSEGTFRDGWSKEFYWIRDSIEYLQKLDHFDASQTVTVTTLLGRVESYTQGWQNRKRFYSPEMRPLLLTFRRRMCQIPESTISEWNKESWSKVAKLLSYPDSCGSAASR